MIRFNNAIYTPTNREIYISQLKMLLSIRDI